MFLGIALAAGLVLLAFSLYVSEVVRRGAFEPTRLPPRFDLEVLHVADDRVTLRPLAPNASGHWNEAGLWGLRWPEGHGRVGRILETGQNEVTREWTGFDGELFPGIGARIDPAAFPLDPRVAFGIEFRTVRYRSPIGQFDGALCDGSRATWVLFVHGKRAARPRKPPYSYPVLPLAADRGFPCLDVAYRNDRDAPASDGLHWYGLAEWEDLDGAARFALDHGAVDLILVGYSMGGAIVTSFLYRSDLAARVAGVILDAPVLDLKAVVDSGIRRRGVPHALVRPGLWIAALRLGTGWAAFDYLKDAERLRAPILLIHGGSDPVVPVAGSDRLARLRRDIVTYLHVPGATHGTAWNVDPAAYESAVCAFLDSLPIAT